MEFPLFCFPILGVQRGRRLFPLHLKKVKAPSKTTYRIWSCSAIEETQLSCRNLQGKNERVLEKILLNMCLEGKKEQVSDLLQKSSQLKTWLNEPVMQDMEREWKGKMLAHLNFPCFMGQRICKFSSGLKGNSRQCPRMLLPRAREPSSQGMRVM